MTTALVLASDERVDERSIAVCRASIAQHSRSFALASRLLSPQARDHAAIVYAWCRAADDAVDLVPASEAAAAVSAERAELERVYTGTATRVESRALAAVVRRCSIPPSYPRALLDGMAMDAGAHRYATLEDLFAYAYRVAGVVGLAMCHVLGVRDDDALIPAAHLGIAMQITNVCRDVAEDWERGRLYLPDEVLAGHGAGGLVAELGRPLPVNAHAGVHATVLDLLATADRYYQSARTGYAALPWRAGFGVRAAARIYRAIGTRLRARRGDALAGRAMVSGGAKLGHAALALAGATASLPGLVAHRWRGHVPRPPTRTLELDHVPRL